MTFAIDPGAVDRALERAYHRLEQCGFADALWMRRLEVWASDQEVQQVIANRLGWLDAPAFVGPHLPRLRAFAESIRSSDISDVILLGMGGSSLAPEVLRAVFGVAPGFPRFRILDSVDPDAVRAALTRPATSLFVLASKSGSTIEPNVLAAEAERRVREAGVLDPGSRFVAITDESTALHARARDQRFREIFINPTDIGGRYSALSLFGMVPAALMGIDMEALLASARAMAEACRLADPRANPGLALGAVIAAAALSGRDKLTLRLPAQLESFGLWVEQLVAESTGKQGKGIVPLTGEHARTETGDVALSDDRIVVRVKLGGEPHPSQRAPHWSTAPIPTVSLDVPDLAALGAEFFRWEVATATAGLLLDVNPFDEPDVRQAKKATGALLDTYTAQGRLPVPEPDAFVEEVRMTLTDAARAVADTPLTFLRRLGQPDYIGLLVYLPPDDERFLSILQEFQQSVAARTGCATTLGYGPRYLHSTGQLHKGGPNTGTFIMVTADASPDLPIPGEPYSFGVLELAQAIGDFESLNRAGRRALHLHLTQRNGETLRRIGERLVGESFSVAPTDRAKGH